MRGPSVRLLPHLDHHCDLPVRTTEGVTGAAHATGDGCFCHRRHLPAADLPGMGGSRPRGQILRDGHKAPRSMDGHYATFLQVSETTPQYSNPLPCALRGPAAVNLT